MAGATAQLVISVDFLCFYVKNDVVCKFWAFTKLIVNAFVKNCGLKDVFVCEYCCQAMRSANEDIEKTHGVCIIDGQEQRVKNFRMEPPGVYCGHGKQPLQETVKHRVTPEEVIINCGVYVLLLIFCFLLFALFCFDNSGRLLDCSIFARSMTETQNAKNTLLYKI